MLRHLVTAVRVLVFKNINTRRVKTAIAKVRADALQVQAAKLDYINRLQPILASRSVGLTSAAIEPVETRFQPSVLGHLGAVHCRQFPTKAGRQVPTRIEPMEMSALR